MAKRIEVDNPSYLFYWTQAARKPCRGRKHLLICEHCGDAFHAARRDARYCGAACRVAAGRDRAGAGNADRAAASKQALATKRDQYHKKTCAVCGASFGVDGTQTAQAYCGAACRQRAYRARQKVR